MNQVILIGNLTAKPELKTTPSGRSVGSASIATNKTYKDQNGEKKTVTQFHKLVIWGKSAEILNQYTDKGSKIMVSGELQTRNWTGQDGIKRYITEILVQEFEFLSSAKPANQANQPGPASQNQGQDYSQQNDPYFQTGHNEILPPDDDNIKVENIPF
jgi:single-strand DNA-binding protein